MFLISRRITHSNTQSICTYDAVLPACSAVITIEPKVGAVLRYHGLFEYCVDHCHVAGMRKDVHTHTCV